MPGPLTGRLIAGLVALTLALAPQLAAALSLIRDAEIERTLERMARPVFQAAGIGPASVDIYIVNNRDLNAFVAAGNNIFLYSGLLTTLETPEELIAVIAHETGHLAGGHQARRGMNLRDARGPALLAVLAGIAAAAAGGPQVGAAVAVGGQSALQRSLLAYNRAEEASADQAAIDYMLRAGVNPEGLLKVISRFRGQEVLTMGNVDPYVQTHPLSTERVQLIERRVGETAGRTFPEDPERAYWHARMRAKLRGYLDDPQRVLDGHSGQAETEEALYAKAVALYRRPAFQEALDATGRLIAMRPADPYYIELKAQLLFETGHAEQAVPLYREAVRLSPEEPLIDAGLGRALLALNTPEANAEALDVLQKARARDLGDVSALRDLATAYSRAGQDGMAALATAERYALTGNTEDAVLIAGRAATVLPEGSPGWLRAQDILALDTDQ
ncbi:MAG TPA: M48 family metalloprotease [Thermohalobaculum sp.]|nr:M48 family metalloprotease [Thermohalobaculum sp.]